MILNSSICQEVIAAAKTATANAPAWLRAVEKAAEQIASNPCITELQNGVLITSPSGNTYLANGVCQCGAFRYGKPCWHRAAAQLVQRYHERLAGTPAPLPVPVPKASDWRETAILIKRDGNALIVDGWAV
ncbi:MAG: SWIM zinc finger family protein [Blastocatellia bacterium]